MHEKTYSLRVRLWSVVLVGVMTATSAYAQMSVGWRTDGSGKYLSATPPTQWSKEDGVVWTSKMPQKSNSTAVVVGDRIFTCAEPATLVCVSAVDGQILWQDSARPQDLAADAEEAAKIAEAHKQATELRKKIGKAGGKLRKAKQVLQDDPEDEALKAKVKQAQDELNSLRAQLKPYDSAWYSRPSVHGVNGFSSATPCSDGERVYALYATGIAACYDLDGTKLWARFIEKPRIPWGPSASPVISQGKLLLHIHHMFALDPLTGDTLWQTPLDWAWGTPSLTHIGDTQVAITGAGAIVATEDGKVLANKLGKLEYCAPVVEDGVAYFIQHGGKAYKLPEAVEGDTLKLEPLWQTKPKKDRYYASPVVHEGLIYAITQAGHFSVIDAANGEIVYEQRLQFGKGTCYPSITMAGNLIYLSCDNGVTYVVRPGRDFEEVAKNTLEPFRACPVFVGDKLYIRGQDNMYCIDGADG